MFSAEGSACPLCAEKGKTKRLISVFYKSQEALYTCEDKMCTYFLTDTEGNLVNFNKESNKTSYILDRTPKCDDAEDDLNNFLNSLASNYKKETEVNFSYPKETKHPDIMDQSLDNFVISNESTNSNVNQNDSNFKLDELFNVDSSLLNFDDLL